MGWKTMRATREPVDSLVPVPPEDHSGPTVIRGDCVAALVSEWADLRDDKLVSFG